MTEQELKRENRKYKKALVDLTNTVSEYLALLDTAMQTPSNENCGKRIARLSNGLDMANDSVLHFTFGQSFQSIGHRKAKRERLAKLAHQVYLQSGN